MGLNKQSTRKPLQSLHRRALKLILLKQSSLEQDDYNLPNVLPLHTRLKYNKGTTRKKIMAGNAPSSLRYLFPVNLTHDQIKINTPTPQIDLFKSSLTFSGASLWNTLPMSLKTQSSKLLKKKQKTKKPTTTTTKTLFVLSHQFTMISKY